MLTAPYPTRQERASLGRRGYAIRHLRYERDQALQEALYFARESVSHPADQCVYWRRQMAYFRAQALVFNTRLKAEESQEAYRTMNTNTPSSSNNESADFRPRMPTVEEIRLAVGCDTHQAFAALRELSRLVREQDAYLYTAAGSGDTRWNVWLETTQRRVSLQDWVRAYLKQRQKHWDSWD